jgi:chromosome segregation ATPase
MFQIRELEMVHWDFWQRISVPLNAQIVTITGPNGSGKTTLLDALRTLLALKCSGRRDYKRYVRNAKASFAWLRGVVDNPKRLSGDLYRLHPFFPMTTEKVTLFCRIKKQGGDWVRHYAIAEGDMPLSEESEKSLNWLGVREYTQRLHEAGLTSAIAEVLALEQGDTDKLCEYTPRALLNLVFQVFGDKAVLDNYQETQFKLKEAEGELDELNRQLAGLGNEVERMRGRANRYIEWKQTQEDIRRLTEEVIPGLYLFDAQEALIAFRQQMRSQRKNLLAKEVELREMQQHTSALYDALEQAKRVETHEKAEYQQAFSRFQTARELIRDTERLMKEQEKLEALAKAEYGHDGLALAQALTALRDQQHTLAQTLRVAKVEREDCLQAQRILQQGKQPSPEFVRRMREGLDGAEVTHQMLSEIIEVTDAHWQGAVEALLAPYRHIILLQRETDKHIAWELAQRLQFRHFIVPEREPLPRVEKGSILEIIDAKAELPGWLSRQLNQIKRVNSVAEAAEEVGDWITPDGYNKERRGARFIGVDVNDHHFGEGARYAKLAELNRRIRELDNIVLEGEAKRNALNQEISTRQLQLEGMDAVKQLTARAEEFRTAIEGYEEQQNLLQQLGGDLAAQQAAAENATEARHEIDKALEGRRYQLEQLKKTAIDAHEMAGRYKADLLRQINRIREMRQGLLAEQYTYENLLALRKEYGSTQAVNHIVQQQESKLQQGDWETDERVLALREKLVKDYSGLESEMAARRGEVERARQLTDEARAAYITKLKATLRAYSKNLLHLGQLAGIEVEMDMPRLENDDAILSSAGLNIRFNFDQKGMMGLNDGEASGGQQVMKSLILLIGLMMDEVNPSGFVFIDEPFAHLDIANIDRVGAFLKATQAQYLITTPNTHNINIFEPSDLTLATRKKQPGESWAPPITQARRRMAAS